MTEHGISVSTAWVSYRRSGWTRIGALFNSFARCTAFRYGDPKAAEPAFWMGRTVVRWSSQMLEMAEYGYFNTGAGTACSGERRHERVLREALDAYAALGIDVRAEFSDTVAGWYQNEGFSITANDTARTSRPKSSNTSS